MSGGSAAASESNPTQNGNANTYPQARHEILNEINNAEVIAAIASWVDRVLSSAGLRRPV